MRFLPGKLESRREFFRAAARYSLLAGLAAAAGVLGRNRMTGQAPCRRRNPCGECAALADCGLPQALSARQALHRYKGS